MGDWYEKVVEDIESQKNEISAKDYRFYMVDRFLKLAERTESFSHTCIACADNQNEIKTLSGNIASFINGNRAKRKELELRATNIYNHLKEDHNIRLPQYYAYLYSFYGTVMGVGLGVMLGLLVFENMFVSILVCWLILVAAGRLVGAMKDKSFLKKGLQL